MQKAVHICIPPFLFLSHSHMQPKLLYTSQDWSNCEIDKRLVMFAFCLWVSLE